MKKKIWITVAIAGWVILAVFLLYSYGYQAHIARHQAEIVKCQAEAFNQGVEALQNRMAQEIRTQGSLRITIDGEENIFVPKKGKRK